MSNFYLNMNKMQSNMNSINKKIDIINENKTLNKSIKK